MKVEVQNIQVGSTGLRCAAKITGPQDSWIRFTVLRVPYDLVTAEVMRALIADHTSRLRYEQPADEAMF